MKIIGFAGRAGHGKDFAAAFVATALKSTDQYDFVFKRAFANSLKERIAAAFPEFSEDVWFVDKPAWAREILQVVGTNVRRERPDFWVEALFDEFTHGEIGEDDVLVITDVRFPNEVQAIKDRGGKVVKMVRENEDGTPYRSPGVDPNHPSEWYVDQIPNAQFDIVLHARSGMTQHITDVMRENLKHWGWL